MKENGVASDKPLDNLIVTRMRKFGGLNALKRQAMQFIVQTLSPEELAGLRNQFMVCVVGVGCWIGLGWVGGWEMCVGNGQVRGKQFVYGGYHHYTTLSTQTHTHTHTTQHTLKHSHLTRMGMVASLWRSSRMGLGKWEPCWMMMRLGGGGGYMFACCDVSAL